MVRAGHAAAHERRKRRPANWTVEESPRDGRIARPELRPLREWRRASRVNRASNERDWQRLCGC